MNSFSVPWSEIEVGGRGAEPSPGGEGAGPSYTPLILCVYLLLQKQVKAELPNTHTESVCVCMWN